MVTGAPCAKGSTWRTASSRSLQPAVITVRRRRGWCWRQAARSGPESEAEAAGFLPPRPKRPNKLEPSFWLSREDAVVAQLKALSHNNFPTTDAGIETLYRFAGFDPFERSQYFGVSLDLGQFERFRRIFYTPYYTTLLNLSSWEFTSSLEVSESVWVARVHVVNAYRKEQRGYQFCMEQRFGGRYDGVWYCSKLLADGVDPKNFYGIM